jgi:hypothetical protein
MTNPAAVTMSMGLPANAQLSLILQSHLDIFVMTRQSLLFYRDKATLTALS